MAESADNNPHPRALARGCIFAPIDLERRRRWPRSTTTKLLEVTRTASDGELKAAYRKLAMKWHPDRNPGDKECETKFKEINEAYDVLKDGQKRAAYDRFGHAAFEQGGGQGAGFGQDFASSFSDIFEDLFGMGGGGAAAADASAARTFATTWRSRSRTLTAARPRRCASRRR